VDVRETMVVNPRVILLVLAFPLALAGTLALLGASIGSQPLVGANPWTGVPKPNAALAFVLAGAAFILVARDRTPTTVRVAKVLALLVAAIGFGTLIGYVLNKPTRFDELIIAARRPSAEVFPGRMSISMAVALFCGGLRLYQVAGRDESENARFSWLARVPFLIGTFALLIFGFDVGFDLNVTGSPPLSALACIGLILFACGLFVASPRGGVTQLMLSDTPGGLLVRRVLLPSMLGLYLAALLGGLGRVTGYTPGIDIHTRKPKFDLTLTFVRPVLVAVVVVTGAWILYRLIIRSAVVVNQGAAADRAVRFHASLLDAIDQAVIAANTRGEITYWNRAAERASGWLASEVLGKQVQEFGPAVGFDNAPRSFTGSAEDGERWSGEVELRAKDGTTFPSLLTIAPLHDETGGIIGSVSVAFDITELKQTQIALAESQDLLRQSQKMDAIGRLAGGIAHDFNNLLGSMLGHSEFVLEDLPEDHPSREDVVEIQKTVMSAAALTRQLLVVSRRQILNPSVLDLNEVVRGIEQMLRRTIGEDIQFVLDLDPSLGHVRADASQMQQVLLNLIVNARQAMPGGGRLRVQTRNSVRTEPMDAGGTEPISGSFAMITVSDTGIGMDKETASKVFEPFFTTKVEGTGFGLATVYGIVQQSGGHIYLYSEPGHGTTFKIYLPIVDAAVSPLSTQEAEDESAAVISETVLVVDDERGLGELIERTLTRRGYNILLASNPETAIELSDHFDGHIDLLVTDVVMPHMSGPELAKYLANSRDPMRVLFMSGFTDDASWPLVRIGADGFLEKPFTAAALLQKVRNALRGEVYR
jgi:two-component system cell cycle sensor histidine kinase/response regulator CckA